MDWETRDDYGPVAVYTNWAMFIILTRLRIYCRLAYGSKGIIRGVGLDDLITIFCWILFLITCVLVTITVSHGLGKHMSALSPEQITESLHWNVISNSVAIWVFSLPKFAIVALLRRILTYGNKTAVLFWGLAFTSQACILATSIWWFRQCTPIEYGWDRSIEGSCADVSVLKNLGYFTSAYSAFLDFFFALYPIPLIMRLNLGLKNRVTISVAMGLSALASAVSVYKLAIFGEVFTMLPSDPTYPVAYLDILGMAEGFILLVCASLPTLGPLIRAIRGQTINGSGWSGNSSSQAYYSKGTGNRETRSGSQSWRANHKLPGGGTDLESARREKIGGSSHYDVDEMPLVETKKSNSVRLEPIIIHKSTDIAVHSEPRTPDSRPTTRDRDIFVKH
ncbi:hypothetical protein PFICI_06263 [Pestalotiopsis fici W106-1]|uniref:Rhodopsin domain-containing protein n=1 Tax=Pestalotiopsis fici (strain W106-1 / CGMCC3.15140) TaxID=1229662 RepID=W3X7X5_PESFW|nr:uncharacterized protein PFICI_06263 [Pestalotiopsis fici W106-1]ETS81261.1 hypothetical protein PFICI_06263 [Pestalotiopsis fici W106-1]